jgi:tRNA 2-thiouridine synthesizing protein A
MISDTPRLRIAPCAATLAGSMREPDHDREWDAGDLGCCDLVLRLRFLLKEMQQGEVIRVHATDAGAPLDLPAWCRLTGEQLVGHDAQRCYFWIQRASKPAR